MRLWFPYFLLPPQVHLNWTWKLAMKFSYQLFCPHEWLQHMMEIDSFPHMFCTSFGPHEGWRVSQSRNMEKPCTWWSSCNNNNFILTEHVHCHWTEEHSHRWGSSSGAQMLPYWFIIVFLHFWIRAGVCSPFYIERFPLQGQTGRQCSSDRNKLGLLHHRKVCPCFVAEGRKAPYPSIQPPAKTAEVRRVYC